MKDVTIIIPVFNRGGVINEVIHSLLIQSNRNWECIIVDDGSTDGTKKVIKKSIENDIRFNLLERGENYKTGGNGARNMGWHQARGEYIMFLDSDDLLHPQSIENRLKLIEQHLNYDLYTFSTQIFKNMPEDTGVLWNQQSPEEDSNKLIRRFIEQDMPWHTNGVLWKKDFLEKIGGWDEELKAWQDWEIHIRALTHSPRLYCSESGPDNYYRLHSKQSIISKHNSQEYLSTVHLALKKAENSLNIELNSDLNLKIRFKYLIFRNLIHYPMTHKMRLFPFKILIKQKYGAVNRFSFFKYCIFELIFSAYRLRQISSRLSYYKNIKAKSTHLKIEIK